MSGSARPLIVPECVRWADVDLVGIMRFSAFTRLVENAEQELWRNIGIPYSEVFKSPEVWLPRRQLSIDYFAPARIDDALKLVTFISRLGDTSLTLNVDVLSADGKVMHAAASLVVVCVTVAEFRKQSLPDALRVALAPHCLGVEAARAWVQMAASGPVTSE